MINSILLGILNAVGIIATWLWFVFVAVMFWKLLFPIVAHRHNFLEKWIHMFALVFGKYSQYLTLLRLLYIECTPEYYAITFKCKGINTPL